ncbi:hypothetical protein FB451DRAFT_1402439 [Mycena latifolia]|nr:hypothetical protein FB451DRAFT_1402439 [Mycena latifolia]
MPCACNGPKAQLSGEDEVLSRINHTHRHPTQARALQVAGGAEGETLLVLAKLLVLGCGEKGGNAAAPVGEAEPSRRTVYGAGADGPEEGKSGADGSELGIVCAACTPVLRAAAPAHVRAFAKREQGGGAAAREATTASVAARLARRAATRGGHVRDVASGGARARTSIPCTCRGDRGIESRAEGRGTHELVRFVRAQLDGLGALGAEHLAIDERPKQGRVVLDEYLRTSSQSKTLGNTSGEAG